MSAVAATTFFSFITNKEKRNQLNMGVNNLAVTTRTIKTNIRMFKLVFEFLEIGAPLIEPLSIFFGYITQGGMDGIIDLTKSLINLLKEEEMQDVISGVVSFILQLIKALIRFGIGVKSLYDSLEKVLGGDSAFDIFTDGGLFK